MNLIRLGDCRNAVQHAKLSFASMCELYSGRSWCENQVQVFFPSCMLTTVFWKNVKIKKNYFGTGSTDWSHIAKGQVPTGVSVTELK